MAEMAEVATTADTKVSAEEPKMPKAEDQHLLSLDLWAANFLLPLILQPEKYSAFDKVLWWILIRVPLCVVVAVEFMFIWQVETIVMEAETEALGRSGDYEDWSPPDLVLTAVCVCVHHGCQYDGQRIAPSSSYGAVDLASRAQR